MNLYFGDESRFGLFTRNGKALTAKSVKPICPFQQVFESTWLFGAFSPLDGSRYLMEFPYCNSANFQIFMDEFSEYRSDEFKLLTLDNGAFHKAKQLRVPENTALLFLPKYSPELNPAEKIWAKFKRDFSNRLFTSMDQLSDYLYDLCRSLAVKDVRSICAFDYIFDAFWTNK